MRTPIHGGRFGSWFWFWVWRQLGVDSLTTAILTARKWVRAEPLGLSYLLPEFADDMASFAVALLVRICL